jgi:hypothetical protein
MAIVFYHNDYGALISDDSIIILYMLIWIFLPVN